MLFTALPFPDKKFREAVDNGNKFRCTINLSLQRIWLHWSLIVTCKTLLVQSIKYVAFNLIFSYFENRTQRTKINNCFMNLSKIWYGFNQGSILGYVFFTNSTDASWIWRFWHWKQCWWHCTLHLCSWYWYNKFQRTVHIW